MKTMRTETLEIAFEEHGPADGWPVILSHGFPYDVRAYDEVAPMLASSGAHVIVPYLRGFGPTRFLSGSTMRSGQQAALGRDLIGLLDGLSIETAIVAGFDWGGLASCVATALWPERVAGLVSLASYDIIDVDRLGHAFPPSLECVMWYQHLFQTKRGRECLDRHRRDLCRMLWEQWSPGWRFDAATFDRTAASFDNPDFVDVVIHCYRFCFGTGRGRSGACRAGEQARGETEDRRSWRDARWRRRSAEARRHGRSRSDVRRSSRAPHHQDRPRPAARGARGICRSRADCSRLDGAWRHFLATLESRAPSRRRHHPEPDRQRGSFSPFGASTAEDHRHRLLLVRQDQHHRSEDRGGSLRLRGPMRGRTSILPRRFIRAGERVANALARDVYEM